MARSGEARTRTPTASTYVALLRGINVGGKNKLPMKELAALFTDAGCDDVRTYIQSGNVIFRAKAALAKALPRRIAQAIADGFGLTVPVVIRSAAELRHISATNPFLAEGADAAKLHVAFLADQPASAQIAALDQKRSAPDRFEARGRDIFLHLPNGVARTKLTNAYFDSRLGTTSTLRNWKTVLKLIELTAA